MHSGDKYAKDEERRAEHNQFQSQRAQKTEYKGWAGSAAAAVSGTSVSSSGKRDEFKSYGAHSKLLNYESGKVTKTMMYVTNKIDHKILDENPPATLLKDERGNTLSVKTYISESDSRVAAQEATLVRDSQNR